MKKTLFSLLALAFLFPFASQAQLVISVGGGYGISAPNDVMGTRTTVDANTGETSIENLYGTVGAGLNLGADFGYMFSDHCGVVLGVNFLLGSETDATIVDAPGSQVTGTAKSNQLRLSPQVLLQTNGETLNFYTRAGFVLPVIGTTFIDINSDVTVAGSQFITSQQDEAKGALSLGYTGAVGAEYRINEMLGIFVEAQAVSLNIKSKNRTIVSYMTNDTDVLPNLDVFDIETVYVDELNASSNNVNTNPNGADPDQPSEELASQSPYSAFFFNLGLKIRLGGE